MLIAAADKVYTATLAHTYTYILGTAGRQVQIHDLRKLGGTDDSLLYTRESNLKHQSRCIRAFTDGSGYITSSIEGRCSVEWVDPAENAKKYSFKCHRHKLGGGDERIFPVNALAFHPVYGSFVTGVCTFLLG
jgi:cell cycle arrest protein BUB3